MGAFEELEKEPAKWCVKCRALIFHDEAFYNFPSGVRCERCGKDYFLTEPGFIV